MTNILFPVETINRELDFRLMLAVRFAAPSRRIYVGQHDFLHSLIPGMSRGVYVGKNLLRTAPPADLTLYDSLKSRGFSVVFLDEEGGFYAGQEDHWKYVIGRRFDVSVFGSDDFVCTWGDFQKEFLRTACPRLAGNIKATGHPRFDLYKPQYQELHRFDVEALRKQYGRYVLVNTNLSLPNHGRGLEGAFPNGIWGRLDAVERMKRVRRWGDGTRVLTGLVALVHRLSIEFPDLNVVVRPHPSENEATYRRAFSGVSNVFVRHVGPVAPWILASELLIHDGCTTAVEAYLANVPTVNFALSDDEYEITVPNLLSPRCRSEEEVVAEVRNVVCQAGGSHRPDLDPRAERVLKNFHSDAFSSLTDVMEQAMEQLRAPSKSPSTTSMVAKDFLRRANRGLRSPFYRFSPSHAAAQRYHRTKFYGFDPTVITRKLETIQRMLGKRITHRQIGDSLVIVEAR